MDRGVARTGEILNRFHTHLSLEMAVQQADRMNLVIFLPLVVPEKDLFFGQSEFGERLADAVLVGTIAADLAVIAEHGKIDRTGKRPARVLPVQGLVHGIGMNAEQRGNLGYAEPVGIQEDTDYVPRFGVAAHLFQIFHLLPVKTGGLQQEVIRFFDRHVIDFTE